MLAEIRVIHENSIFNYREIRFYAACGSGYACPHAGVSNPQLQRDELRQGLSIRLFRRHAQMVQQMLRRRWPSRKLAGVHRGLLA
jgi:hypothetical protein